LKSCKPCCKNIHPINQLVKLNGKSEQNKVAQSVGSESAGRMHKLNALQGWLHKVSKIAFCWLLLAVSTPLCAEKKAPTPPLANVTFFVNSLPGTPFWESQIDFAKAVSKAFKINLTISYIPRKYIDRFGVAEYIDNYLDKQAQLPDLIVSSLWLGAEVKVLQIIAEKNISYFSINNQLTEPLLASLGTPRVKFPRWLGHIATDDVEVGAQLTEYLLQQIEKKKACTSACPINLFAFSGFTFTTASQQREKGLSLALAKRRDVHLFNVVHAAWDKQEAYAMMPTILQRHDDIDGYWIASDFMALGVLQGLQESTRPQTAILASIDWSPDIIKHIKSGAVSASLGGHFMEAGWAITLYADALLAGDFAASFGTIFRSELDILDGNNIKKIGPFLAQPHWNSEAILLNSRFYNKKFKGYSFSPLNIINAQLNAATSHAQR
jgi:ABC-type sugar transport system substrate-binding protein